MDPQARDHLATVAGAFLAAGSSLALHLGLVPWQATAGAVAVGFYLMLPRYMRWVGDWAMNLLKAFRSDG